MTDSTEQGGQTGDGITAERIKVGEKEYSADDIQNLLSQSEAATQKSQQASAVLNAAEKYGLTPEDLLTQAEGAFSVMANLINDGVIDNQGNLVKKPEGEGKQASSGSNQIPPGSSQGGEGGQPPPGSSNSPDPSVQQALEAVQRMEQKIQDIDRAQSGLIRSTFADKLRSQYSNLGDEEIEKVFTNSMNDTTKSIWDHAQEISEGKSRREQDLRKKHAEEFGVDLEKFDENKLKEGGPGGGAAVVPEGKKVSFTKGEKTVTPREAATEFLLKQKGG